MTKKITFGNFKGGTGKTTNSTLISYHLAKQGFKTLLVDLDPQANATSLLLKTAQNETNEVITFSKTLMTAISEEDLSSIVTPILDNLYLLPSFADFTSYPLYLEKKFPNSQKDSYTDTAVVSSDYIVIVLQTQERSFVGAEAFIQYTQEMYNTYKEEVDFDILGILPVLLKNTSKVDQTILEQAKREFGEENIFTNVVKNMERVKRYDMIGITNPDSDVRHDMHDKKVHALYSQITNELLERLNKWADYYKSKMIHQNW